MIEYLKEELLKRNLEDHIPQMEYIVKQRENGNKAPIPKPQCKCWPEVSCLNNDSIEWSQIEVQMYNMPSENGGIIQIRNKDNQLLETVKIYYCPFCGRFLG